LPGGMPGTLNLKGCAPLRMRIAEHHRRGGLLAAICAAPTVLGSIGILKDKRATCYPGMEKELNAAEWSSDTVVVDGNVVTSRGAGTAFDFALTLLSLLKSETVAQELAAAMCFERKEK